MSGPAGTMPTSTFSCIFQGILPPPPLQYRFLTICSDVTEEPSKTVPVGAIVGAVVGGVVVLVGLLILAVFIYRRKRSAKEPEPAPESTKEAGVHNVVLPYKGSQETLSSLVSLILCEYGRC
ncbi:hypothetical protein FRC08_002261 [Ceratobasidium sp. 394]|nr:hypothetical protein FRC08_002261 [Ceratobasidium sp. 394]